MIATSQNDKTMRVRVSFTYNRTDYTFERNVENFDRNYDDEPYALIFEHFKNNTKIGIFEINVLKNKDGNYRHDAYVNVYRTLGEFEDDVEPEVVKDCKVVFIHDVDNGRVLIKRIHKNGTDYTLTLELHTGDLLVKWLERGKPLSLTNSEWLQPSTYENIYKTMTNWDELFDAIQVLGGEKLDITSHRIEEWFSDDKDEFTTYYFKFDIC